jgi:hypothetical protein
MKKLLLSASLIAVFMLYVLYTTRSGQLRNDEGAPPRALLPEDETAIMVRSGMGSGMTGGCRWGI